VSHDQTKWYHVGSHRRAVSLVLLAVSGDAQTQRKATMPQAAAAPPAAGKDTEIRPFKFHASDEALADLRRRGHGDGGVPKW
jgi:hypothetical protein